MSTLLTVCINDSKGMLTMSKLKNFMIDIKESMSRRGGDRSTLRSILLVLVLLYLLITTILGFFWSSEPELFSIEKLVERKSVEMEVEPVVGLASTATVLEMLDVLLEKPGGYLSNDMTLPGLWMDNIPNWEFGVLVQLRDFSRAMRKDFSRSQSQSTEDKDLSIAEPQLHFDNASWALPSSESEYRKAYEALDNYLKRLVNPEEPSAQFYARADNLRQWLLDVETRLGSLSQRLSASVGKIKLDTSNTSATQSDSEVELVKTPWLDIDNVFYEARGTAWALTHIMKAIQVDFEEVLDKKNAQVSLRQIIRELEATQDTVWSPLILNGSGFGMFANHSLVMASYISRANAAIVDLRELLSQG